MKSRTSRSIKEEASMTNEDIKKSGVATRTSNGDDDGNRDIRDPNDDGDGKHAENNGDERTSSSSPSSNKKVQLPSLTKLLLLARPEFRALALAFLLMIVSEGAGLYNPILLAQAYDALVDYTMSAAERMSDINRVMILVIIIHSAGMVAGFLRSAIMGAAGERVVARLRNKLYGSILKQEIAFFDEHKTGELVSRLGSDTTLIQAACSLAVPECILGLVKVITCVALMFWLSPQLAGVTLGFTLLIFVACVPFGRMIGALAKQYQDALGSAQNRSTEALGSVRTVQSFAAEDRERRRYSESIGDPDAYPWWVPEKAKRKTTTYGVGVNKAFWQSGFYTFLFGVGFGSMYISLWYGFKLVVDGKMTLGELTAFQSYIFQIGSALGQTSRFLTQVIEARGASGRIFQLLERVPAIPAPPRCPESDEHEDCGDQDIESSGARNVPKPPLTPKLMMGEVNMSDVSFSYPSRRNVPVLTNFNLTIPANSTAALVGSSGAGKSTVVNLLQRFYDIDSGSITVDGNDIRDLDLTWLRQKIGYVQQEPQLFGMTVRENVCYGVDKDVPQEEIEKACRQANAYDFVMEWPKKFETLVGERGIKLSGGQKQRLAIARALLVNPRILLLDEATSALDAESEHLVQNAIDNAVVGRTTIIVAHRLSTIKNADQIIVLDGQEIADCGTHDALMRRCSKYQDLIKRQSVVRVGP